jgi:hypothetical protein
LVPREPWAAVTPLQTAVPVVEQLQPDQLVYRYKTQHWVTALATPVEMVQAETLTTTGPVVVVVVPAAWVETHQR